MTVTSGFLFKDSESNDVTKKRGRSLGGDCRIRWSKYASLGSARRAHHARHGRYDNEKTGSQTEGENLESTAEENYGEAVGDSEGDCQETLDGKAACIIN